MRKVSNEKILSKEELVELNRSLTLELQNTQKLLNSAMNRICANQKTINDLQNSIRCLVNAVHG
jgi:hypothetical protein